MSNKHFRSKEAGMVAIMVTLILMIVISLIVLGFAQISRRNQRQALDRQLSTQAFYAAESGVNDAAELIKTAVASGATVADKPDCASTGGGFYTSLSPVINADNEVEYTCLMVDSTPPKLVYSGIGTTSTIVPLKATSGSIAALTFTWQSKASGSTPAATCPTSKTNVFAATTAWPPSCGYGVLRFDLVPTAGAALSLNTLQSATMTSFIVPLRPGSPGADSGTMAYAAGGSSNLRGILCSNTECSLTINNLSQSEYHLRVSSLYKDVSFQVSGTNAVGGPVDFEGAQALVDATGKAQDVLRRVQVRIPLRGTSTNLLSDFAIQSTEAICKRFSVMDGFFRSDANTALANAGIPGLAASTDNDLCE